MNASISLAHAQRVHAERCVQRRRPLGHRRVGALAGDDLDQREQVDGIERVGHDETLRVGERLGEHRRPEARRRRGDDRGRVGGVDREQCRMLEVEPFGHALDDEAHPTVRAVAGIARLIDRGAHRERTDRVGRRLEAELAPREHCVRMHFGEHPLGVAGGVVGADVDAAEAQPGDPAGADDATSDRRRGGEVGTVGHRRHPCFVSCSCSRTSAGPLIE